MNNIILSIVIPHYNVAPYIDCLYASLFSQLTSDVEVILLEDCSTDNTKEKMQKYERNNRNPNIQFIYLDINQGLSGARNIGLSIAQGEYVWFIDSDDFIETNVVSQLLYTVQTIKPEGIVFDFYKFEGSSGECYNTHTGLSLKRSKIRSLPASKLTEDNEQLLQTLFDDAQMYVWCYVLKKKYWQKFPFPEGKKFEDVTVMPKIMYELNSLYYIQKPLYYYRQRANSILSAPTAESCFDMGTAMYEVNDYFKKYPLSEESQIALYTFYLRILRLSYGNLREHQLLSKSNLQKFLAEEAYFYTQLPWNRYRFIQKMKTYKVFKFTSVLFVTNKKLYSLIKRLLGKY